MRTMKRKPIIARRNPFAKIVGSLSGAGAHRKTQKALRRADVMSLQREIGDDAQNMQPLPKTSET